MLSGCSRGKFMFKQLLSKNTRNFESFCGMPNEARKSFLFFLRLPCRSSVRPVCWTQVTKILLGQLLSQSEFECDYWCRKKLLAEVLTAMSPKVPERNFRLGHAKLSKAGSRKQSHVIKVDLIYARPAVLWMESGRDKTHSWIYFFTRLQIFSSKFQL